MIINLQRECLTSKKREFFYGAKLNKTIQDVYLGSCFLEPGESKRKVGPGKGHEEILFLTEGKIKISTKDEEVILNTGEVYFIPDGSKVFLENLNQSRCYFIIAGGHTKSHSH